MKPDAIREALATFSGVDRRFQMRGEERGITVIDDYGHHPTEIRATLDAARLCGFRRIHVLFQPHRYTRTCHLMDEFARAFHQADTVFVMDIYAASEKPIEGVTAEALVERIRQFGHRAVEYVGTMERGVEALYSVARGWRPGADAGRRQRVAGGRNAAREIARSGLMAREKKTSGGIRWRLWLGAAAFLLIAASTALAAVKVRQHILTDSTYLFSHDNKDALTIQGMVYAPRAKVAHVFAGDFGHSVLSIPLDERRRRLLAIDWVEDASVARIWPDRLIVRMRERRPVAFVFFRTACLADRPSGHVARSASAGAVRLPCAERRARR